MAIFPFFFIEYALVQPNARYSPCNVPPKMQFFEFYGTPGKLIEKLYETKKVANMITYKMTP